MEQDHKDPYKNSKGSKKVWNYFLVVYKTDKFKKLIKEIRDKYKIEIGKETTLSPIKIKSFDKDLVGICNTYGLDNDIWFDSLEKFVFKDELIKPLSLDLCILSDNLNSKDLSKDEIKNYPIIIRISPYASKRDILNYIERTYSFINHFQENYRDRDIRIGKFKTRNSYITERDDYIWENRNLPRREILKLLIKKYGNSIQIDEGCIGKIISNKNKEKDI